jgi:hypothetical protein
VHHFGVVDLYMYWLVYEAAKKWLLHVDDGDEEAEDRLSVQLVAGECWLAIMLFTGVCCMVRWHGVWGYGCCTLMMATKRQKDRLSVQLVAGGWRSKAYWESAVWCFDDGCW